MASKTEKDDKSEAISTIKKKIAINDEKIMEILNDLKFNVNPEISREFTKSCKSFKLPTPSTREPLFSNSTDSLTVDEMDKYVAKLNDIPDWLNSPPPPRRHQQPKTLSRTMAGNSTMCLNETSVFVPAGRSIKTPSTTEIEPLVPNTKINGKMFDEINEKLGRIQLMSNDSKNSNAQVKMFEQNCNKLNDTLTLIDNALPEVKGNLTNVKIDPITEEIVRKVSECFKAGESIQNDKKSVYSQQNNREWNDSVTKKLLSEVINKINDV